MTAPLVRITLGAAHEQLIKVETGSACLQSPLGLSLPDVSHVFSLFNGLLVWFVSRYTSKYPPPVALSRTSITFSKGLMAARKAGAGACHL